MAQLQAQIMEKRKKVDAKKRRLFAQIKDQMEKDLTVRCAVVVDWIGCGYM